MDPETTTVEDQPTQGAELDEATAQSQDEFAGEESGTSADAGGDEQQQTEAEAVGAELGDHTDDSNWLPDEAEALYPDDTLARYAEKRYPGMAKALRDPNADPELLESIRFNLRDKINIDRQYQQQNLEDETGQTEEVLEEEEATGVQQNQPAAPLTPEQRQQALRQHFQEIDNFVERIHRGNDDILVQSFDDIQVALGANKAALAKVPQQAKVQGMKTVSRYLVNLMLPTVRDYLFGSQGDGKPTIFAEHFSKVMGGTYEGFDDWHSDTTKERAWNKARAAFPTAKLPAFDPTEGSPFFKAMQQLEKQYPGIADAQFSEVVKVGGKSVRRALSPYRNWVKKAQIAARLLSGQPVNAQVVNQAVATGRQVERQNAQRRANANLGAGQSTRNAPRRGTGNDDLFGSPGEVSMNNRLPGTGSSTRA